MTAPARDPAPSRAAYRLHRLWLTPFFRALLRVGLPAFALAFGSGLYLSDPGRRAAITGTLDDLRTAFRERPEFMVSGVAIEGASALSLAAVTAAMPDDFPVSSFSLDLDALRAAVERVDAVARADLRVGLLGVLNVRVDERLPAVLWRGPDGLTALDAGGHRVVAVGARVEYPGLPLIAGAGADTEVTEARALWAAASPLSVRMRGLVRMGTRRWDVVLDGGQRILLPERDPVSALERVIALHHAREVLSRDVAVVDLRNPRRPTLRMNPPAVDELRRIRALERGGISQ